VKFPRPIAHPALLTADLRIIMTSQPQFESGAFVEMTSSGDPVPGVRVIGRDGSVLTLSLALDFVPPPGSFVTVRWPGGERGRYAQDAVVVKIDENRIDLKLTGDTRVEQQRNFVRGGGGEEALMRRDGQPDAAGWIRDISEQSVRAHFTDVQLNDGDEFTLRVMLETDVIELSGTIAKTASLRQTVPQDEGATSVEIVAVLNTDELQAKAIRRYVLKWQLLARARGNV
jgi:hypothetical protein